MNKAKFSDLLPLMTVSLLILIFLEVLMTTLFPILGLTSFRLPFHILLVLFLAFNVDTPYIGILILLVMLVHSLFTVESWAIGTATGIFVIIILSYIRELIHLGTPVVTIFVTEIFLLLWNFISSGLIYFKDDNFSVVLDRFLTFLPASLVIALLSPMLFAFLEQIWSSRLLRSANGEL